MQRFSEGRFSGTGVEHPQGCWVRFDEAHAETERLKKLLNEAYGPTAVDFAIEEKLAEQLEMMTKERDALKDILALLAPDLKVMAILYAQQGNNLRANALSEISKSVGVV